MSQPLLWLDVFTDRPLTGNGLAVVGDADGVSDATMAAFARETNLSETTFVQSAAVPGADYRNRIWMPAGEIDFAGHPSLGTAVAVARWRGEDEAAYVQETRAGIQPIEVRRTPRGAHASMLQNPATFGAEADPGPVLAVAGLDAADADPALPCQVVSTGLAHLIAPVRDRAVLARIRPDGPALARLLAEHGATTLYLVARDGEAPHARSLFVVGDAWREDPATGSAAGPLMAYLHARTGLERARVAQGVEMRRPSRMDVAIEGDRVRVGGDVVVLFESRVDL